MSHAVDEVDPFDLPDWLGTCDVTWTALSTVRGASRVSGELSGNGDRLPCDLLAADLAYPEPLLEGDWRRQAHQAWTHGQVLLVEYDGRLTLAVPGTAYSADGVLETIGRLAKALGVRADRFTVTLRL
ncbi:MAG: hypothetical protein HOQ22_17560 [Nocardioidaceae bacterium]|nr:hypothetical protein [Nocardioidaceae bacterium]NUS52832.1 hypothetical protein [Nocardioidaceae bacterium]